MIKKVLILGTSSFGGSSLAKYLIDKKITPLEASLGFVIKERMIDSAVLGFDTIQHIQEIVSLLNTQVQIDNDANMFNTTDQNLINPSNWCKLR